ncbi:hypothetical protein MMC26_006756 [Xylographa opegraphella]|nr:hypothetical protein [Xylographa opegraphella]
MKSVLEQAYADAVKMANLASNVDKNSFGFTHYFGGNRADTQYTHFTNMMKAIGGSTQFFSVQFECSGTAPECVAKRNSSNAPNISSTMSRRRQIHHIEITRHEERDGANKPRNFLALADESVNFMPRLVDPQTMNPLPDFLTAAGHTIIHELTHLDSLASQAGLSGAPDDLLAPGSHGTNDEQEGCELQGARNFLRKYNNNPDASPDYNAESYAAAATEIYFMDLCTFKEIRPLVGTTPTIAPPSSPSCAPGGGGSHTSDVRAINVQLDNKAGTQCCSGVAVGCTIAASSGTALVSLCNTSKTALCIDCGRLANCVIGMIGSCQVSGTVAGTQTIPEEPGLSMQISINDTT